MTTDVTEMAWSCLVCLDHGSGPKADLEARHHEKATNHGTTTHLDKPWWASREEVDHATDLQAH